MSDGRKNAGVGPWIVALLIGLPVLYVLSFGPACALIEREILPESAMTSCFFQPCLALATDAPEPVRERMFAWVEFCGGGFMLAEFIARKSFEGAPYRGVAGGLFP